MSKSPTPVAMSRGIVIPSSRLRLSTFMFFKVATSLTARPLSQCLKASIALPIFKIVKVQRITCPGPQTYEQAASTTSGFRVLCRTHTLAMGLYLVGKYAFRIVQYINSLPRT